MRFQLVFSLPEPMATGLLGRYMVAIKEHVDRYNQFVYYQDERLEQISILGKKIKALKLADQDKDLIKVREMARLAREHYWLQDEFQWRNNQHHQFSQPGVLGNLINNTPFENQEKVTKLLSEYTKAKPYVLHSASGLYQAGFEELPRMNELVKGAIKLAKIKSREKAILEKLQKEIEIHRQSIAASMAMRLESAFSSPSYTQDDPLVYTYNRLLKWGAAQKTALHPARKTLTPHLMTSFYRYINQEGDSVTKKRIENIVNRQIGCPFAFVTTSINKVDYDIPAELVKFIPIKKPLLGSGKKQRYEFFQQNYHVILLLKKSYNIDHQKSAISSLSEVSVLSETLKNVSLHFQQILKPLQERIKKQIFKDKTKRFFNIWSTVLSNHASVIFNHAVVYLKKALAECESLSESKNKNIQRETIKRQINQLLSLADNLGLDADFLTEIKQRLTQLSESTILTVPLFKQCDELHLQVNSIVKRTRQVCDKLTKPVNDEPIFNQSRDHDILIVKAKSALIRSEQLLDGLQKNDHFLERQSEYCDDVHTVDELQPEESHPLTASI